MARVECTPCPSCLSTRFPRFCLLVDVRTLLHTRTSDRRPSHWRPTNRYPPQRSHLTSIKCFCAFSSSSSPASFSLSYSSAFFFHLNAHTAEKLYHTFIIMKYVYYDVTVSSFLPVSLKLCASIPIQSETF